MDGKCQLVPTLSLGRGSSHTVGLLKALLSLALSTARVVASTTSLASSVSPPSQ